MDIAERNAIASGFSLSEMGTGGGGSVAKTGVCAGAVDGPDDGL